MGTARHYDGTNDYVRDQSFTALDSGDWSLGLWYNQDDAPSANNETLVELLNSSNSGVVQWLYTLTNGTIQCRQLHGTQNAQVVATAPATGVWNCAIGTYESTGKTCSLFLGDIDTPMAEPSYTTDNAGTGVRNTGGNYAGIGCNPNTATSRPFDGKIAVAFCVPWAMTQSDAEKFRSGDLRVLWRGGTPRFVVLFSENGAYDLADPTNVWTISGAVDAEGPPVRFRMRSRISGQFLSGDITVQNYVFGLASAQGILNSVSLAAAYDRAYAKTQSLADAMAKIVESLRAVTKGAGFSDQISRASDQSRISSDTTGLDDNPAYTVSYDRTDVESEGLTDSSVIISEFTRETTSPEGATDALVRVSDILLELQYVLGEVDAVSLSLNLGENFTITVQDGSGILDTLVRQWEGSFVLPESQALIDSADRIVQFVASILDDSILDDTLIRSIEFGITVQDGEGVEDWVFRLADFARSRTELISVLETLTKIATRTGVDIRLSAALVEGDRVVRATLTRDMIMKLLEEL